MFGLFRHLIGGLLLLCAVSANAHAYIAEPQTITFEQNRCFAIVKTPAQYERRLQRVEVQSSYNYQRRVPAIVEHQRLRIQTKEASQAFVSIAPVYTTVFEQVLIAPERTISVEHPAEYVHWTETIEVEPETLIWKRCGTKFGPRKARTAANTTGSRGSSGNAIMCRQLIPAKERIVHHSKLVKDAWTEQRIIPAQYKTLARQVLKQPSEVLKVVKGPEFAPIAVAHEIAPARYEDETTPAIYREEYRDVLVGGNQLIRAEVLCDAQVTRKMVAQMQTALVERGYYIKVDGIYGPETQGAMELFQADQALSRGYMTLETVEALGISVNFCDNGDCGRDRVQTTVRAAQQALSQAGFSTQADGIHGPQTQASLEAFQREKGLELGFLSAETMIALNLIDRI